MLYEIVEMECFEDVLQWISGLGTHIGLIVFGPESRLKTADYDRLLGSSGKLFGKTVYRQEHTYTWTRREVVLAEKGMIVKLNGSVSSNYSEIKNISKTMRDELGMKLVIGIYVKGDRSRERFAEDKPIIRKQDSNANGLDFLILHKTTNPSPLV